MKILYHIYLNLIHRFKDILQILLSYTLVMTKWLQ